MKHDLRMVRSGVLALAFLPLCAAAGAKDCGPPPGTVYPFALELARRSEGSGIGVTRGATDPPVLGHWNDDDGDTVIGPGDVTDVVAAVGGDSPGQECVAVFDGSTLERLYRGCRPQPTGSATAKASGTLALGLADGDGLPDIVVPVFDPADGGIWVEAYSSLSSEPVWVSPATREEAHSQYIWTPFPSLTDLEGDGQVEVLLGQTVLDGRTGDVRWSHPGWRYRSPQTLAVDLNMDGVQEIVNGATALAPDGSVLWSHPELMNSFVAVGNLDGDPFPEIVVTHAPELIGPGEGGLTVLNHDGSTLWHLVDEDLVPILAGGSALGDLDGDGETDIVHSRQVYVGGLRVVTIVRALSGSGTVMWEYQTTAVGGSPVHPVLYDMDGDWDYDVLIIEEDRLTVLDGRDGAVLSQEPLRFPTVKESPAIADLEGDGQADVVVLGSEPYTLPRPEILVYTNPAWGETRSVWNQWSYMPEHIAEDGRVLYPVTPGWLTHNTFRAQVRELNRPPVADAGPDFTVECASWEGTPVVLDGSRSWDPDDDPLTFTWQGPFPEGGGAVEGERVQVTLPLGVWEITLLVADPCVQVADTVVVTVQDTTPPEVVPERDDLCLWPPDHRYGCWESGEVFVVRDACDETPAPVSVEVTSSQDPLGGGSGNFEPDWVISEDGVSSFCLRAEREGADPEGRIYSVTLLVVDASGNEGEGALEVLVPHDWGQAVRECAYSPVRATVGPEDRFLPPFPGLPNPLPDRRLQRLRSR
jgi:hypothetical protein